MKQHVVVLLARDDGREIIRNHCRPAGFDIDVIESLVDAELKQVGKKRKAGLWAEFDDILDQLEDEFDVSQKS